MEISKVLDITQEDVNKIEMHSVINLITVIVSQLQVIQLTTDFPDHLNPLIDKASGLADAARAQDKGSFNSTTLKEIRKEIMAALNALADLQPVLNDGHATVEYIPVFQEILDIASIRIDELNRRWNNPEGWETISAESFRKEFEDFFHALEVNSKGRYRIIYNIAEQEERDYLVNFSVKGDKRNRIYMPLLFKDVTRDLISNARKYTPPGGQINIGVSIMENHLRFVVEDSGYGIPQEEIEKVVVFGYRGSNIREKVRTMGGGFGLTKAWFVTKKLSGRMWIESALDRGTKITLQIPLPDHIGSNE